MLTIEQVLENNSANEGVGIVVANVEQYNNLITLLHNQGYLWKSGQSLITRPFDLEKWFKEGRTNCAFVIFFNSNTKKVVQCDIEDEATRTALFIKHSKSEYYILKPYILFDKELEKIADTI